MSVDVRNFLDNSGGSNFTDSVARPPPQGEENERQSTGGHSAKSSGSLRSQHSGKSHGSSGKSAVAPTSSAAAPAAIVHSPGATPRKSHHQQHGLLHGGNGGGLAAGDAQLQLLLPSVPNGGAADDDDAPLGFEPEGICRPSAFRGEDEGDASRGRLTPPLQQQQQLPPAALLQSVVGRWAESLESLLEDADGAGLFREFLDQQQCRNLFEFYFAWKYLNQLGRAGSGDGSEQQQEQQQDTKTLRTLIKTMFKVYIKGDKGSDRKLVTVRTELKEAIVKRMADRDFQSDIYDQVKDEVMERLRRQYYPEFLRSELYSQYVASAAAAAAASIGDADASGAARSSGGSSGSSSGSSSARGQLPASALLLPTLHEDCELDLKASTLVPPPQSSGSGAAGSAAAAGMSATFGSSVVSAVLPQTLPLTQDAIRLTERIRQDEARAHSSYMRDRDGRPMAVPSLPYHATTTSSYLPISAIDSERQSLSSDALTDDTLSVTDSSVDGYPIYNKERFRRYHMKLSKIAQRNPDNHPQPAGFQPRTERMSKISSLAEIEPHRFAEVLTQRLQALLDDDKRTEMIQSRLNAIRESEDADDNQARDASTAVAAPSSGAVLAVGGGGGGGGCGGSSGGGGLVPVPGVAVVGGAGSSMVATAAGGHHNATKLNQLLLAMQQGGVGGHGMALDDDADGDAQGILDMHCKRIWEKSGQHSPTKSPHSPPPQDTHGGGGGSSRRAATLPRSHATAMSSAAAAAAAGTAAAVSRQAGGSGATAAARAASAGGRHPLHGASAVPAAAGGYVAATDAAQPVLSAGGALYHWQESADGAAAAAAVRQMQLAQPYGQQYLAGVQPTLQASVQQQQQLLLQQQLLGGQRHAMQQPQQLLLSPTSRLPALHPQFATGSAGSAFKPVALPSQQQQQQQAAALLSQQLQLQQQQQIMASSHSTQFKVMEWINRNEEITHVVAVGAQNSDSEKASSSHKRSSHKSSTNTAASPRQHRPKSSSHTKKLQTMSGAAPDSNVLMAGLSLGSSGSAGAAVPSAVPAAAIMPPRVALEELARKLDERNLSSQLVATVPATAGKASRAAPALPQQQQQSGAKERKSTSSGGQQQSQRVPTAAGAQQQPAQLRVAYYLNDQPIPYSTTVPMSDITLLKFKELVKELIAKKGTYRYFFKKANDDELGSEIPHFLEEVTHDAAILPKWEGKVIGYVKKVD